MNNNTLREPPRGSAGRYISRFAVSNADPYELLQLLKEIRGYSYSALGRELGGFRKGYLSEIFCGKKIPRKELGQKIADFFSLPIGFLWKY